MILGAIEMVFAGGYLAFDAQLLAVLIAATIGVMSPSGYEVGPFLSMNSPRYAVVSDQRRTQVFAWYNLIGSFATALGSLCGGVLAREGKGRV